MRRACEQFGSARRVIVALLGAMALLALSPAASSAAVNFNVKGKWTCSNRGVVIPLNGARAELWHEISYWPDDKVGSQRTAADGSFNFGVHASSNVTLYVKLVLNDDRGVNLGDWYSFSDWDTQTNTVGSHSGTVNLGTWQISKNGGSGTPKCAIWQGAHNAYTDYKQVIGANPPAGHYSISADFPCCGTPFTTLDTTRWPGGYQTGNGTSDPGGAFSVNFHEFAHSVRHSFDGDTLHFLGDVARYSYPQTHTACKLTNTGFAFNEGWAEYWAHTAHSCPDPTNLSQEGNVATKLMGLEKCADRPSMVRVLRESRGAIHSYTEFSARFFAILGARACLTPPITGLEGLENSLTAQQLTADVQAQIAAQNRLIAGLSSRMRRAKTVARSPGSCPAARRCVTGLEKLIEPSALNAQLAQAKLVLARLRSGLAAAQQANFMPDFAQQSLYDTLAAERQTFDRANQAIVITGLKQSMQAIKAKSGFGPAKSTAEFRRLSKRLSSLTGARKRGKAIPSDVASLFSAPSTPLEGARRVSR
ncbi:MAG: DUF4407 domain-containing protein [Actinomycetota bacterium]|nr:DUF4407 domain-containing protein [Actinomycetota bacterium]